MFCNVSKPTHCLTFSLFHPVPSLPSIFLLSICNKSFIQSVYTSSIHFLYIPEVELLIQSYIVFSDLICIEKYRQKCLSRFFSPLNVGEFTFLLDLFFILIHSMDILTVSCGFKYADNSHNFSPDFFAEFQFPYLISLHEV